MVKADRVGIVFLVGPRGCGKTLAATMLERDYGCRVCDTDAIIRARTRKTVAEIVDEGGWPAFRALEKEALGEAVEAMRGAQRGHAVIATGGGMVLDAENRARMRAEGTVVYLSAPPSVLAGRLEPPKDDPSRPSLTGLPLEEEIATVLRERESLYREAAHHVVDASRTPEAVVRAVHGHLVETSPGMGAAS